MTGAVLNPVSPPARATYQLTQRQAQILKAYAEGHTTDSVAEALGISAETVRTHSKRILAKLNAASRAQATAMWGAGVVSVEDRS